MARIKSVHTENTLSQPSKIHVCLFERRFHRSIHIFLRTVNKNGGASVQNPFSSALIIKPYINLLLHEINISNMTL